MRIVAVADTHLFHDELTVPAGDVFVHAGDMCRGGSLEELAEAARWLRSLPHPTKVVIAGNHDWALAADDEDERRRARALLAEDGVVYLQDEERVVGGLRFWGSPWQPEFNDWAFNLPRGEALAAKWALVPTGVDVLVTHGPPRGIGDRGPGGGPHAVESRAGCDDLRARVAEVRPRLHLFGHIHQDGGAWPIDDTLFANATTWECERAPTVIDVPATGPARVVVAPPARR